MLTKKKHFTYIRLLLPCLFAILLTACGDVDKGSAEADKVNTQFNLTENGLWDHPVFDESQTKEFANYVIERGGHPALYAELKEKNGHQEASYDELMDFIQKLEQQKPFLYNAVQAELYKQAFLVAENDSLMQDAYWGFMKTAQQDVAMPRTLFLAYWYAMVSKFHHEMGMRDLFYSETARMTKFFHEQQMEVGIFLTNSLVGASLLRNFDYKGAFERFTTADSILVNHYKEEMGKDWKAKIGTSPIFTTYANNHHMMVQCKLKQQDTLWLEEYMSKLNEDIRYTQSLPVITRNLSVMADYYAWVGKDSEYKEAMGRLHEAVDTIEPSSANYKSASTSLLKPSARYELKHNNPHKALEYAIPDTLEDSVWDIIAQCYEQMGDYKQASEVYKLLNMKKAMRINGRNYTLMRTLAERATLENKELELMRGYIKQQQMRTIFSTVLVGVLVVITIIIVYFLHKQRRLNRNLSKALDQVQKAASEKTVINQHLSEALEQAKKADHAKAAFLQSMTHEIRTPLNAITGFAQMLQPSNEEDEMMVDELRRSSAHLKDIVDTIITMSDYESDSKPLPTDETSVLSMCHMTIDRFGKTMKPGITIGMATDTPQDDIVLPLNRQAVNRILHCLVENAIKFTEEGSITIGYRHENQQLQLSVTDTGRGIPEADRERVFERFVKLDAFVPGSGLGLSLVRVILNRMGGEICVDPTYTNGTRMNVSIPL